MAEKQIQVAPHEQQQSLARREPSLEVANPFRMLERFAGEMDRVFDDFGFGRGWLAPRAGSGLLRTPSRGAATDWQTWTPDIEMFHRNNELVIRAELPGLTKDDIKVDITDEGITIQGERKWEHEEERQGVYRSERRYGKFYRMIPLPEGVMSDQAKATFKDGILEITMPAPPEQVRRGRRLEIAEGSSTRK
jgi:HSP20 family protein